MISNKDVQALLARTSFNSVERLELMEGKEVYAVVKASSVMVAVD